MTSVFGRDLAMGHTASPTKLLYFSDVSNVVKSIAKSCYFCEGNLPSVASNKVVIVKSQLVTFNCFPFLRSQIVKTHLKFLLPFFSKSSHECITYFFVVNKIAILLI